MWCFALAFVCKFVTVPTSKNPAAIQDSHPARTAHCWAEKPTSGPTIVAGCAVQEDRILLLVTILSATLTPIAQITYRMPLPCELIVFRVLKRNPLDENGQLKERDFILKAGDRGDGLSLFTSREAADECRRTLDRMDGLATLHVGHIRDLSRELRGLHPIDVIEVPSEDFAGHVVVVNLPDPFSGRAEDADLAETLGRMLAAIARPVRDPVV